MTTQYLHFYLHILILLTTIYYLQPLPLQELTFRRLHLPLQITVMVCRRFLPCIFFVFFFTNLTFPRINPTLRATTSVLRFYFLPHVSNSLRQSFVSQIFYASPSCLKLSTADLRFSCQRSSVFRMSGLSFVCVLFVIFVLLSVSR